VRGRILAASGSERLGLWIKAAGVVKRSDTADAGNDCAVSHSAPAFKRHADGIGNACRKLFKILWSIQGLRPFSSPIDRFGGIKNYRNLEFL
jgi:hypothetical protein